MSKREKDYPFWDYSTRRDWLRHVRSKWVKFRNVFYVGPYAINTGSAYYPKEVYEWLKKVKKECEQMDLIMKEYYKNA